MKIETLIVGPFEVNCLFIHGSDNHVIVIDPGQDAAHIIDHLNHAKVHVAAYLLTHGHCDHIAALSEVYAAHPAPVGMHTDDASWAFISANQFPPYYPPLLNPPPMTISVEDGGTIELAGLRISTISTPGHTPGCVCFHFVEGRVLITGDTLFAGSVGRTDLPGGDPRLLAQSLKKLRILPAVTRIYPGHGPDSTIGREIKTNYFMTDTHLTDNK